MTRLMLTVTILFTISANQHVAAEVQTKSIEYRDGGVSLQGFLAWDATSDQRRPGVLVVHEWWGLNDYARGRATQLAELGYVAFALDMYGKGKVTEHPKQAGQWATTIRKNADAWRARARAGLKILKQQDQVDPNRLAAIGYCFGGSTVLQLAFGGDDLRGVVSFHGSLPVPTADEAARTKSRLLVCHGAADRFIPAEQIGKFQQALDEGGVDWQMVYYAGAKHSFTNPGADAKNIDGIGYNKKADQRSWGHMQAFFDEIFAD
jgi:dienelactone hydrolase